MIYKTVANKTIYSLIDRKPSVVKAYKTSGSYAKCLVDAQIISKLNDCKVEIVDEDGKVVKIFNGK